MDANESYFDYEIDVIEQEALNRKSCVQALQILIPGLDTQIEELEEELFLLETQLEWADQNKYKEWFELCCKGVREYNKTLELSLSSLKNGNMHNGCNNDAQSKVHGEPVKKFSDIIKGILKNGFQDGDEQPADVIAEDLKSDSLKDSIGQCGEQKTSRKTGSSHTKADEAETSNVNSPEKSLLLTVSPVLENLIPNPNHAGDIKSDAVRDSIIRTDEEQPFRKIDSGFSDVVTSKSDALQDSVSPIIERQTSREIGSVVPNADELSSNHTADIMVKDLKSDALRNSFRETSENKTLIITDSSHMKADQMNEYDVTSSDSCIWLNPEEFEVEDNVAAGARTVSLNSSLMLLEPERGNISQSEQVESSRFSKLSSNLVASSVKVEEEDDTFTNIAILNSSSMLQGVNISQPDQVEVQESTQFAMDGLFSSTSLSNLGKGKGKRSSSCARGNIPNLAPPRKNSKGKKVESLADDGVQEARKKSKRRKVESLADVVQESNVPRSYSQMSINSVFNLEEKRSRGEEVDAVAMEESSVASQMYPKLLHGVLIKTEIDDLDMPMMVVGRNNSGLSSMTVARLKELAKSHGIKGYTKMTKAQLIKVVSDRVEG